MAGSESASITALDCLRVLGGCCSIPMSSAILLALSNEWIQNRMYSSLVVPAREGALHASRFSVMLDVPAPSNSALL